MLFSSGTALEDGFLQSSLDQQLSRLRELKENPLGIQQPFSRPFTTPAMTTLPKTSIGSLPKKGIESSSKKATESPRKKTIGHS